MVEDFEEFKRLYTEAKEQEKESFMFKEQEVLVDYAKYVISYIESFDRGSYDDLLKYKQGRSKH